MLAFLLIPLALQTPMAEADVPLVVEAALEAIIPNESKRPGPLYIDTAVTADAFRKELVPGMRQTALNRIQRPHRIGERHDVVTCAGPMKTGRGCSIEDGGLYVAITRATRTGDPAEYLITVQVDAESYGKSVHSSASDLYLRRVRGEWKVVRTGVTRVG